MRTEGRLLEKGADLETRDLQGNTALLLGLQGGASRTLAIAKLLLDQGAVLDAQNNAGRTALMLAAYRTQASIARLLVDRGADSSVKDPRGLTAAEIAAERHHLGSVSSLASLKRH